MEDMEEKPKTSQSLGQPLNNLSVHELERYISALKMEIERAHQEKTRKEESRKAAENLFARPQ